MRALAGSGASSARGPRAYVIAAGLAVAGLTVSALALPLTEDATYPPLVAAAAISAWVGGRGPGLLSVCLAWPLAFVFLARPRVLHEGELSRWLLSLIIALLLVWLVAEMRRTQRIAARSGATAESLQQLATALSAVAGPSEVAHELIVRLPRLLGATGGSLGLVEGEFLVIVDPTGALRQTLVPGLRLPLSTRAPITAAARSGAPVYVGTRTAFEREYPDGARLAPSSSGALAVPLRIGEGVVGSMGFPFATPGAIDEETISVALLAADIGSRALERARRFEQEHELREALDRVAKLAPLFANTEPDDVPAAICREARVTFDADAAQLWHVSGDRLLVHWREPPSAAFPPGTVVEQRDFSGFGPVVERLETVFVPDAFVSTSGPTLDLVQRANIRSVLRVPIVIGGRTTSVLALMWERVIAEPAPQARALSRRFADHAGLALEQAARLRAQESASRSADQTRRLLAATAALAVAASVEEVASATAAEAARALGARAAVVARPAGQTLELLADAGERAPGETAGRDGLLASALERGVLVVEDSRLAAPLVTAGGRALAALGLELQPGRQLDQGELDYLAALGNQAGQAFERATLLDEEQAARRRAEQMAGDLAQLHALSTTIGTAGSAAEVAQLVSVRARNVIAADAVGLVVFRGEHAFELLNAADEHSESLASDDTRLPPSRLLLEAADGDGQPVWLVDEESWDRHPRGDAWRSAGITAGGVIPLVVAQRVVGALFASFGGGRQPGEPERRLFETMAQLAAQPLERLQLLEHERSARLTAEEATRTSQLLTTVAERLAAANSPTDVAIVIATEAVGALGADASVVYGADHARAEARLLASDGLTPETLAGERVIPLGASTPVTDVIRTGEPLAFENQGEILARYPQAEQAVRRTGEQRSYCSPLRAGGRVLGAVYYSYHAVRTVDREALAIARAVFRQCAQALDRARLFEETLASRRRTEELQSLTSALSGALTSKEVATVFVDEARAAVAADGALLAVVDPETRGLQTADWRGYPDDVVDRWLSEATSIQYPSSSLHVRHPVFHDGLGAAPSTYPELVAAITSTGHRAFAIAPISAGAAPLGVAILSWSTDTPLGADEASFIEAFASQCGLALDRARQYESERAIAETLQRSILPEALPAMQGVQVAVRYLPGTSALDVGGDWFDTIPLPSGRLGFVVGDVVGKGVRAAATMAQLRNGMRALTLDEDGPGETVTKLNRLLHEYTDSPFATLAYLTLDPVGREATLVSAGHLPPLVLDGRGGASFMAGGRGLPLGVDPELEYEASTTTLAAGSTVILYTDGLVERRDRPIDDGLELLQQVSLEAPPGDPHGLVDSLVESLLEAGVRGDDVAVLAVKLDEAILQPLHLALPAEPATLPVLRHELETWLRAASIPSGDAHDVVISAWEAITNAIEHALESRDGLVRFHAELIGDRVHVEVADSGRWRQPEDRPDRGLGLHLIRTLMHVVQIDQAETGTTVVMERSLTRERVGENGTATADD